MTTHRVSSHNSWNGSSWRSRHQALLWSWVVHTGWKRFGRVEQPQTHEKLSYDPCTLWSFGASVGLNYRKIMASSSTRLLYIVWLEGSIGLNHPKLIIILMILELSGSRRFGRVEQPQTHGKLLHTPVVVWLEGWTTQNSWEINITCRSCAFWSHHIP